MATTIVTKYGGDAPAASDIVRGELAVDTENGRLYTENAAGAVVEIGLNPEGNVDVTGTVTADKLITDSGVDAASFTSTGSTYVDINNGTVTGRLQTISSDFFIGTATVGTSLAFKSGNGVEAMRISSSGNVGIGRTPTEILDILSASGDARIRLEAPSGSDTEIKFFNDGAAQYTIGHDDATDNFVIGAANVDAPLVSVTKSGSVGIGVTPKTTNATVTGSLNVNQAGLLVRNSNQAYFASNIYWDASDQLKSHGAGYGLASLFIPSDGSHRFFNTTAAATGADENLTLNETMRVDASGNLLVGTTDSFPGFNDTNVGTSITSTGRIFASSDDFSQFNRNSDGDILRLVKSGTKVGSISAAYSGSRLAIGKDGHGLGFVPTSSAIIPHSMTTNLNSNGTTDLGTDGVAFRDLYLSGGAYLGGTTAANHLDDYEEGTWTPTNAANITINTINNATYTKVGRQVTVNAWLKVNIGAANPVLGSLPFSAGSDRSTTTLSNITQQETPANQIVGTSIYLYGSTTSGTDDDLMISATYNV